MSSPFSQYSFHGSWGKRDAFASAPAGIQPEWYFLFMFQTLKFIPSKFLFIDGEVFGIMLFGLAGLLWLLVPFWDKKVRGVNAIVRSTTLGFLLWDI